MFKNKSVALKRITASISVALASHYAIAAEDADTISNGTSDNMPESEFIQEMTIVGSAQKARGITGSAHFIGPEQLKEFNYSDIQRIIRQVPGVSIQIEDGYGLRPNISIRGVATERSGRITLLEDNILIAPAPYSAPSAYYFPTAGRMSAVEVLKGPAAITQGPYTIGGALNMISTPIPQQYGGSIVTEAGEDASYRVHASYGGRSASGFGFLLEAHQWQSDGFQSIDRSSQDTGLDVTDYTVKLSYAPTESAHQVELKLQSTDQSSEQSYLGLTDSDFSIDPYRRYGISELDNINTEHEQVVLSYSYDLSDNLSFSATAYNNEHARAWFKTEAIDFDGSSDAQNFDGVSWSNVVNAINLGQDLNGLTPFQLQGILDGSIDTAEGSIQLRDNDREYYSRGIQLGLNWNGNLGKSSHNLQLGLRLHEDEEDRLQRNNTYNQVAGKLELNDRGELGNAGNHVQNAEAVSLHIYDDIEYGNWVISPGLRYEDIDQSRTRYNDGELRTLRDSHSNQTEVLLPGLGILYKMNEQLSILAGVHEGFTAPSNSPGVKEEKATNFEFGFRYNDSNLNAEVIAFLSDYENLLGECTSSSGTGCTIGDAFNGDAATVEGIEVMFSTELSSLLSASNSFTMPLSFNYTYINGEFNTNIADTEFFGDVSKGDPLPYIPENQFSLSLGFLSGQFATYLSANYVDEVCVRASCGLFEKTDNTLTLDLSANYQLSSKLNLFGRIENLTAEEDILGRQPYGARPNKDRTATIGARFSF